jgi:hypothetical protein
MDGHGQGWRLRAARAELGLTEDMLAAEMRRWAEFFGEPRPEITPDTVADWEGGLVPLDLATIRLLWLVLEVPSWNRVALAGDLGVDTWSLFRPSDPVANLGQRRRELLHYLARLGEPSTLDPEHLNGALEATLKIDRRLVEGLARASRRLAMEWGHESPQVLRQHVHGHLQIVQGLLDGLMPSRSRRELESAAATSATFAGLISIVVDQDEDAGIYLQLAERFAESAGDSEVLSLALMFSSHLSSALKPDARTSDPVQALALIDAATRLVSAETSPLARAWVLVRGAEEYAWNHDEAGAFRMLDEAQRLSSVGGVTSDGLAGRWNSDTHISFRGEVAALCGRHDVAIPLLEMAVSRMGPERVASRPRALVDLAAAHAQQGEVDHACGLLSDAFELARRAGLGERMGRVVGVRQRLLARHAGEPAVRRLDEQVRTSR